MLHEQGLSLKSEEAPLLAGSQFVQLGFAVRQQIWIRENAILHIQFRRIGLSLKMSIQARDDAS